MRCFIITYLIFSLYVSFVTDAFVFNKCSKHDVFVYPIFMGLVWPLSLPALAVALYTNGSSDCSKI